MKQINIGKDPFNHIVFSNETVSRHHLTVYVDDDQEMLLEEPEPSTWGTYIDGRRIKKARLRPGQKVLIGNVPIQSEKLMELIWRNAKTDRDFSAAFQKNTQPHILKYERKVMSWKLLEDYLPYISGLAGMSINLLSNDKLVKFTAILLAFALIVPLKNKIKAYFDHRKERLQAAYKDKIVCPNCKNSLILEDLKAMKNIKQCRVCEVRLA